MEAEAVTVPVPILSVLKVKSHSVPQPLSEERPSAYARRVWALVTLQALVSATIRVFVAELTVNKQSVTITETLVTSVVNPVPVMVTVWPPAWEE